MRLGLFLAVALTAPLALAQAPPAPTPSPLTREQWIDYGQRVHGGFGVLIAAGIRIGQDAMTRLGANRRQLDVTYFHGKDAPCPCIVDGVLTATSASPGQGTLRVAAEPAAPGWYGEVLIARRDDPARAVRYCIRPAQMAAFDAAQATRDPVKRYDAVNAVPFTAIAAISPDPARCPAA